MSETPSVFRKKIDGVTYTLPLVHENFDLAILLAEIHAAAEEKGTKINTGGALVLITRAIKEENPELYEVMRKKGTTFAMNIVHEWQQLSNLAISKEGFDPLV